MTFKEKNRISYFGHRMPLKRRYYQRSETDHSFMTLKRRYSWRGILVMNRMNRNVSAAQNHATLFIDKTNRMKESRISLEWHKHVVRWTNCDKQLALLGPWHRDKGWLWLCLSGVLFIGVVQWNLKTVQSWSSNCQIHRSDCDPCWQTAEKTQFRTGIVLWQVIIVRLLQSIWAIFNPKSTLSSDAINRGLSSTLYLLQTIVSYLNMLVVMTFNVWFLICVVFGSVFGHWLLFIKIRPKEDKYLVLDNDNVAVVNNDGSNRFSEETNEPEALSSEDEPTELNGVTVSVEVHAWPIDKFCTKRPLITDCIMSSQYFSTVIKYFLCTKN